MDDFGGSVTMIHIGTAAGGKGPVIFLCKGKVIPKALIQKNLVKNFKLAEVSCVISTPTAFLTDDTWITIAPIIAKGIRSLPVVRNHPDWFFTLTLDGFASHLNAQAFQVFKDYKIMLILEDGDTSDTNQP